MNLGLDSCKVMLISVSNYMPVLKSRELRQHQHNMCGKCKHIQWLCNCQIYIQSKKMVDGEFKILHSCKMMTLTDQTKPDIIGFCQATIRGNAETYKFKAFLPNVYLKAMPASIKMQQGKIILDNLFEKNGIKSKKYTLLKWAHNDHGAKISLQPSIEFIQSLRSQRNKLPKFMAKAGESNLLSCKPYNGSIPLH